MEGFLLSQCLVSIRNDKTSKLERNWQLAGLNICGHLSGECWWCHFVPPTCHCITEARTTTWNQIIVVISCNSTLKIPI